MIKHLKYSFFTLLIASTFLCCALYESAIKPFEDIIIQTDRDVYVPGETIWFKANYLLEGKKSDQFDFYIKSIIKAFPFFLNKNINISHLVPLPLTTSDTAELVAGRRGRGES